jgi:DNA ligase-1
MTFHELAELSRRVGSTRSRRVKVAYLAEALRGLGPEEVEVAAACLSGELRQGRVGIGYSSLSGPIARPAAGRSALTLVELDQAVERLAGTAGPGSQARRLAILRELFGRVVAGDQAFLRSLLLRELRQGALEGIMLEAIAEASGLPEQKVRRAAMVGGALHAVARAALVEGEAALAGFRLTLFRPLQPMLAETAQSAAEALGRLGRAAVELKLDGARIQAHRRDEEVRLYTRNLREVTPWVPELVRAVQGLPVASVILDGEAIALRPDGRPQPFQVTMSRFGTQKGVEELRKTLPLKPFFFDCLHLDGEDLIDRPAEQRADLLRRSCPAEMVVPRVVTGAAAEVEAFLSQALAGGHEGVMLKSLEAPYEAGRRGAAWLKLKPAHTLDLVVLAAEWGSGRRRGWLSNLHLGARDPEGDSFVMLGKTFKGLTDQMLQWQTQAFLELEVSRGRYTVYLRPELVVEVAFDSVQSSPRYPAGLALRFARVKGYRPDKSAREADTIETVRAIHEGRLPPGLP